MLQVEQLSTSQMMRILETAKSQPAGGQQASFEEVRKAARQISDEQERQWFTNKLHEDLDLIRFDQSVVNGAVDISLEGLAAMHDDKSYRDQIMQLINRAFSSTYYPRRVSIQIEVGGTLDEYRVDTWAAGEDTEFKVRSADSFYRRMGRATAQENEEFTAGMYRQFRDQLLAVKQESERRSAQVSTARVHQAAARMYESAAIGSHATAAYAVRAYEG